MGKVLCESGKITPFTGGSNRKHNFIPFLHNFEAVLYTYTEAIQQVMHARELNFCLKGEVAEVAAGFVVQCCRESREFPEYTELVLALC